MKTRLMLLLSALLAAGAVPHGSAAQPGQDAEAPDYLPYAFAGIRYGARIEEAIKRFGPPLRSESVAASEQLSWADGQLIISFNKKTRRINSFATNGPLGVSAVEQAQAEPLLSLLTLGKAELARQLGSPTQSSHDQRRMSWDYAINPKIKATLAFHCPNNPEQPCTELDLHWTGTAIWDPDDGVDTQGLRTHPICAWTTNAVKILAKRLPTGIRASTEQWDLEVYENTETGGWTLIGKSKATQAPEGGRYCTLASGDQPRGYVGTPWHKAYFKP